MKKMEKRKNFIKKHMRNSDQGLGRRKKKQAKNKATDINKALLPHNRMTFKSKVISPENRLREGTTRRHESPFDGLSLFSLFPVSCSWNVICIIALSFFD